MGMRALPEWAKQKNDESLGALNEVNGGEAYPERRNIGP